MKKQKTITELCAEFERLDIRAWALMERKLPRAKIDRLIEREKAVLNEIVRRRATTEDDLVAKCDLAHDYAVCNPSALYASIARDCSPDATIEGGNGDAP